MEIAKIRVTRDSVCMGDDVTSPNGATITFEHPLGLRRAITAVARSGYLPSMTGASWIAEVDGAPVAVVAEQWDEPKYLDTKLESAAKSDFTNAIHFRYRSGTDPDQALAALKL